MSDDPIKFRTGGQTTSSGPKTGGGGSVRPRAYRKLDNAKAAMKNRSSADE
jgi:hypothetical protein